jgi:hypothetical protein
MKKAVIPFPAPGTTSLHTRLCSAIANKRLIQFTYNGAVRIAEPHDYGVRDGSPKVLAYQRWKAGEHGQAMRGWRWLDTSKIEQCVVLDDTFAGTRADADQHHHRWDALYARVDDKN